MGHNYSSVVIDVCSLYNGYNGYFLLKNDCKLRKNDDDDDVKTLGNIYNRIANGDL